MCDLKCNILTEKYIDKILEPLKTTNGKLLELSQSYIERDFHSISRCYYVWIRFKNNIYKPRKRSDIRKN